MPVGHLYISFGKISVHILYPFFNQVVCFLLLSCVSSLYILEINPLLDIWFASIFSQFVDCLFILFLVSFALQKLFNLKSHLFIFSFVFLVPVDMVFAKSFLRPMSKSLLPIFSPRSFRVLDLTFKSLMHLS